MDLKGAVLYTVVLTAVLLGGLIFLASPGSAQAVPDITCRISTGSPGAGEKTIFTFQNGTGGTYNAHGAQPSGTGAYTNKVICTNFTTSSFAQAASCAAAESGVLSFSNYTNAHTEPYGAGTYGWQACGRSDNEEGDNVLTCVVRAGACKSFEGALVSLQSSGGGQTNAHLAEPGAYANTLCCSLRCAGATCIVVTTPAPEIFSPTGAYATYDVQLFNKNGEQSVRVELYLLNEADYTDVTKFGQYGTWDYKFTNETGDFYPAQTTVGPKATKLVTFKVRAPSRAPPSTDLEPYKFIVRVRDA